MLDRVQPHPIHASLPDKPANPSFHLRLHVWMLIVDIGKHQEVEVGILLSHRLVMHIDPLVVAQDNIYRVFIIPVIVIGSRKMFPAPLEIGVLSSPSREGKAGEAFNLVGLRDRAVAVVRIYLHHSKGLKLVAPSLVIKHHVGVHCNPVVMQRLNAIVQLLFGAVFRSHGPFLVKLSQVVQVISRISHVS